MVLLIEEGRRESWRLSDPVKFNGALYVAESLRDAMVENTGWKVFCSNGYSDGATPFFGTEYTLLF